MKGELEGIIAGLQAYLAEVQDKAARQQQDFDSLTRDRAELIQRLRDMEGENQALGQQAQEISQLREVGGLG